MTQENQSICVEDLLASIVENLKYRGHTQAIAIIAEGEGRLEWLYSDDVHYYQLLVATPIYIFSTITEIKVIENDIYEVAKPFFHYSTNNEALHSVIIAPQIAKAKDEWRSEAMQFIKGENITNQGRAHSNNIASKQHKGLLFRSKPEIMLFDALTRAKLAVAPLPVFIRIGKQYNRLEPDFVVIHKGLTFIIEVDGDLYHKESPAEAEKRLLPLTHEGVEVRRIRSEDLSSDIVADEIVRDLIRFMDSRKASR